MAITADGLIALEDGDSDWVSEADEGFEKSIHAAGALIVGNRTFEQYQDDLYPMDGVTNVVITQNNNARHTNPNVHYAKSPSQAVNILEKKNISEAILIGGGTVNGLFIKKDLVDEIVLIVHPLVMGNGIRLFENFSELRQLKLVNTKKLKEDLVQLHYKVIKG